MAAIEGLDDLDDVLGDLNDAISGIEDMRSKWGEAVRWTERALLTTQT